MIFPLKNTLKDDIFFIYCWAGILSRNYDIAFDRKVKIDLPSGSTKLYEYTNNDDTNLW